jgi:signal transduction histidine kinase
MKTHGYPVILLRRLRLPLFVLIGIICFNYLPAQRPDSPVIDSLIMVSDTITSPEEKLKNYNHIAQHNLNFNPALTFEYATKAYDLATATGNKLYQLRAMNSLSAYYLRISVFDSSLMMNKQAASLAEELNDQAMLANLLRDRGRVFFLQGKYPESLDATFQAVRIFESLGDASGMATSYNSIGNIYQTQQKMPTAIEYFEKSLEYCELAGDKVGIITVMGSLAATYSQIDSLDKAIEYYGQAIEMAIAIDFKAGIALNYNNLALAYMAGHDYKLAKTYFLEAIDYYDDLKRKSGVAIAKGNLGVAYFRSYDIAKANDIAGNPIQGAPDVLLQNALQNLKESVEIYEALGELAALAYFTQQLSEALEAGGQTAEALRYFKLHAQTRDSIQTTESKIQIERLTTEREVELKNKQIELDRLEVLKKRNERVYFIAGMGLLALAILFMYRNYANQKTANTQLTGLNTQIAATNSLLEQRNSDLTATLTELRATQAQLIETEKQKEKAMIRERISQDIHDDISSGLAKISWLAEMLKVKSKFGADSKELSTVDKILSFSRESVSRLGEIIWSTNPEKDNLESLLAYMRRFVSGHLEDSPINYQVDFPDEIPAQSVNPELRRNLFLAFKEALHNASKYSHAQNIRVSFETDWNIFRLIIADDGVGLEKDVVHGGGFGISNMRKRMEAVGGSFTLESLPQQGARVMLEGKIYS